MDCLEVGSMKNMAHRLDRLVNEDGEELYSSLPSTNQRRVCRNVFSQGSLVWTCRNCQADPTCVQVCENKMYFGSTMVFFLWWLQVLVNLSPVTIVCKGM